MSRRTQTNTPRILISHAWEDEALARRLEVELTAAGAKVWNDQIGIRGGDNLPGRINEALEWCNTLLLIWSEAARKSHWVELEWMNAVALNKRIIPCLLSKTQLPLILAHPAYVNFRNVDQGIAELLRALNLTQPAIAPVTAVYAE